MVMVMILSNQSQACSAFTSPFGIGSPRLEPQWRRAMEYQVAGLLYGTPTKRQVESNWVDLVPCDGKRFKCSYQSGPASLVNSIHGEPQLGLN